MSRDQEEFVDFIRQKGYRLTGERLRLIEGIKHQHGHFNVDGLVSRLKKQGLEVSRDTIYRNIPVLLEAGVIAQSFKTNRDTYYEAARPHAHHDHLICRLCGKVIEFKDKAIERAQQRIAARRDFKLDYHCHQLIGCCKKCLK
ncbi:MAG: transcriptional repressor [Candidatus Omnitrophica bacterium]|nr:transcriptional repressor [Candidatus Omnitrophota bacterium]